MHHEEQTESHRLIEQLMILANEQVAGYLADRRVPTLYRVHERPDPQAVEFLVEQLARLDVPTPPVPKNMTPQQAAEVAAEASRIVGARDGRAQVDRLARAALAQAGLLLAARTSATPGWRSPRYCHFTSPIRRYPDLVVHRALLQRLGIDDTAPRPHELDEAAVHSSAHASARR